MIQFDLDKLRTTSRAENNKKLREVVSDGEDFYDTKIIIPTAAKNIMTTINKPSRKSSSKKQTPQGNLHKYFPASQDTGKKQEEHEDIMHLIDLQSKTQS